MLCFNGLVRLKPLVLDAQLHGRCAGIQAVIIALPILKQPEVVLKCLQAGKAVLSEKPIADDVKSALQLISAASNIKGAQWFVLLSTCSPSLADRDQVDRGKLRARKLHSGCAEADCREARRLTIVRYINLCTGMQMHHTDLGPDICQLANMEPGNK